MGNKKLRRAQMGPEGAQAPRPAGQLSPRALRLVPGSMLTLATTAPIRPTITIDGLAYRMSFPEDFALWQNLRLQKLAARANEFDELALEDNDEETVTPEQWAELEVAQMDAYGEIVRIVLPDLPEATVLALTLPQRRDIVQAFFAATSNRATTEPEEPQTPTETLGADVTAETSPTGIPS